MVVSKAATVPEYLRECSDKNRATIARVRKVILKNLPPGYEEAISYGMIGYQIPLADFPHTYNGQPLSYVGLAAQKNYNAIYLSCSYQDPAQAAKIKRAFADAGKRLNMGKCCIRFRNAGDLPLAALGKIIASIPPKKLIAMHEKAHDRHCL